MSAHTKFGMSVSPRLVAAVLAVAVAGIHIRDQGGFPGSKTPAYVGYGFYLLECGALLVAALLAWPTSTRLLSAAWTAAGVVGAGPLAGYVLSRGPGMPHYSDDRGNWTEPLGLASLAVETILLVLSVVAVVSLRGTAATEPGRSASRQAVQ